VVDSAIYEAVLSLMESVLPEWEIGGYQRQRSGSVLPGVAPSNVYPAAAGDQVVIAANRDTVFARLAETMGRPELAREQRFATHDARAAHQDELDDLISEWTATFGADRLLEVLRDAGVPAGLIYQSKDMLADPHFAARRAIVRLHHALLGEFPMQNVAPRLSDTPGAVRSLGPQLGEHNDEIYRGLLGLGDDDLRRLRAAAVI
jgi:formyl-CoA transferase